MITFRIDLANMSTGEIVASFKWETTLFEPEVIPLDFYNRMQGLMFPGSYAPLEIRMRRIL